MMTLVELEDALWGYHHRNSVQAHFTAMQIRAWGGKVTGSDIYINPFDSSATPRLNQHSEEGRKEVEAKIKELRFG